MTRAFNIPEDIWDAAGFALSGLRSDTPDQRNSVARAIMDERERCALVAEQWFDNRSITSIEQWEPPQVLIAAAIRKGGSKE